MRLTNHRWLRLARLFLFCLAIFGIVQQANGQAFETTTVQGTVYLANGQAGSGTLSVSWPTFTTAAGQLVTADRTTVAIGTDGFVSINLAPNQGAMPAGEFYTATFYMSDGAVNTEYWIVPAAAQATLVQVQAQVMPAAQAVQAVSKAYVDQAISELSQSVLSPSGGNLTGPLFLSGDPTQPLQAADKHYIDTQVATTLPANGCTSSIGGNLNCPGSIAAQTAQSSVSPECYVTAYGGVGNCSENGSTASCTDNTTAFNSAISACLASGGAVVLPPNPTATNGLTVYYVASPIDWKGVSIRGPVGGAGTVGGNPVVAVRGAPGKDVFAIGDPTASGYVKPLPRFSFRDFGIVVDDSIDSSSSGTNSFPNRLPGRTFMDATTSLASANGITAPTYSSGGSATGTGTCLYADSGGFGGNGAEISFTVANGVISSTTAIVSPGFGYTSVPTNWTFVSNSPGATCAGNVTTTGGTTGGSTYELASGGQAYFQPGDVGQQAAVWGAGNSTCPGGTTAGANCLITQIIGYVDGKHIYLSTGSTIISSAHAYVSVMGMAATQTIGNGAVTYDSTSYNGPEGAIGSSKADFTNLNITTTDNTGHTNNVVGFFFQGAAAPYGDVWSNDYIKAQWGFAFVPSNGIAPGIMCAGICDFNVVEKSWVNGSYPFLAYGGNQNLIQGLQISIATQGPNILDADAPAPYPDQWYIDIPQIENPAYTCASMGWMAYRVAGENHSVGRINTPYCTSGSEGFQWDASNSTVAIIMFNSLSPINITGSFNSFTSPLAGNTGASVWSVTGFGNTWETCANMNPTDALEPGRCQYAGLAAAGAGPAQLSRGAIAFNRTHDFIDKGASNYYLNGEDLWMWPAEVGGYAGTTPGVVADMSAESGTALYIPTGTQANYYIYEANNSSLTIGSQIPAGPMRVYIRAKASAATTFFADAGYSATGGIPASSLGCNLTMSLTVSYQVFSCDVNTAANSGDLFGIRLGNNTGTAASISIDWLAVEPWNANETAISLTLGQGATPMTGVAGNGGLAQETTGATKKSGDFASFDANGNVVDSSIASSNVALLSGGGNFQGSVTGGGSNGTAIGSSGLLFPTAGTSAAPSAPQLGTWTSLGEGYFPVSAYGALGTASDDGPAIQAAINAAEAWGASCAHGGDGVVVFNSITYAVKSALTWDPSVSSIVGNGAILNMSASTVSGPMVTVAQTNPVCQSIGVNAGIESVKNTMQGLYFRGPGNTTGTNLFYYQSAETTSTGNQSDTYNSQVEMDNVSALQFNVVETFGNNAYLVRHKNVHWSQCNICISAPAGLTNSGENISYIDGVVDQSNQALNIVSSFEFYFKGTSFDFNNCGVYNFAGHLTFENAHWEWNTSETCSDYFEQDNYAGGSMSFVHGSVQMDGTTGASGDIFDARSNGLINIDDVYFNNMIQSTSQQLVSVNPGVVRIRNSRASSSSHIYTVRSFAFGTESTVGAVAVMPDGSFESNSLSVNQLWIGADTNAITSRTAGTNVSVAISNGSGVCGTAKYGTYSLAITKTGAAGTAAAVWIAGPMPTEQMVAGVSGWYNKLGTETGTLTVSKYWMNVSGNNQYGIPIVSYQTQLSTAAAQDSVTFSSSAAAWTQFAWMQAVDQNIAPAWANYVGIYYDLSQMNAGTVCIDGVNLDPM